MIQKKLKRTRAQVNGNISLGKDTEDLNPNTLRETLLSADI